MAQTKRPFTEAKAPKEYSYRSFITAILDGFWTPYNIEHPVEALEYNIRHLFKQMSIELVVFNYLYDDSYKTIHSTLEIERLINFLNEKIGVSLVFIAKGLEEPNDKLNIINLSN